MLEEAAIRRHAQAYRPGTKSNHQVQIHKFLTFCNKFNFQHVQPTIRTVILYIEFLAQTFVSPNSVKNYVSAIRHYHSILGKNCYSLDTFEIKTMLRALEPTMHHIPNRRRPVTPGMLKNMLRLCQKMGHIGKMMRVALLFGYLAFLRQSNLAPLSADSFDPTRHTCRGDMFFLPPGLVLLQKWSKTNLAGKNVITTPIPATGDRLTCPVMAYKELQAITPVSNNSPLLLLPTANSRFITVDIPILKSEFTRLLHLLDLPTQQFSLHSL